MYLCTIHSKIKKPSLLANVSGKCWTVKYVDHYLCETITLWKYLKSVKNSFRKAIEMYIVYLSNYNKLISRNIIIELKTRVFREFQLGNYKTISSHLNCIDWYSINFPKDITVYKLRKFIFCLKFRQKGHFLLEISSK